MYDVRASGVVIGFVVENGECTVELFDEYRADNLVRECHCRERQRTVGTGIDLVGKAVRTSDNEAEPFDSMMPTLENVTDYFAEEFFKIIYKTGGMLTRVEASETPTRSYIVNIAEQERNSILNKKADEKIISEVMDAVLDDIVKQ